MTYNVFGGTLNLALSLCCAAVCSIFAIGDCIEGPMLAHKAEDEGISLLWSLLLQSSYSTHLTHRCSS